MSNDCSERICQFGLAHVDSPKGDLDASNGALSGPDETVIENNFVYKYGTQEQYPQMIDFEGGPLDNTGHYYMECSNKGLCDRSAGACECFPGYEGSACQRASCPVGDGGMCSGHGTCHTIREIADLDHNNLYELWDKHSSMGCVCDAGYSGPDCSDRACKFGIDPLYNDDKAATARVSNWTVDIFTEYNSGPGSATAVVSGTYSITFFDVFGEDWETVPISADAKCDEVIAALESIPNNVIPLNSVLCLDNSKQAVVAAYTRLFASTYDIFKRFILSFPQNPGKLQPLRVNFNLDGPRPTLTTDEAEYTLRSLVYADGFSGEFIDYVPDLCEGVTVTLDNDANGFYLADLDFRELAKIKRCLGDSDGITTQDSYEVGEVYNWDFGDYRHPHLIKLVDKNRDVEVLLCNSSDSYNPTTKVLGDRIGSCQANAPAGFYLPLWYDAAEVGKEFRVIGSKGLAAYMTSARFGSTAAATNADFNVFTTKGFLTSVNGFGDRHDGTTHHANSIYQKPITANDNSHLHWHGPDESELTADEKTVDQSKFRIDCETFTHDMDSEDQDTFNFAYANSSQAGQCLQKGDLVMFFDLHDPTALVANIAGTASPLFHNIYTVEKIFYDRDQTGGTTEDWDSQGSIVLDKNPNFYYAKTGGTNEDLLAWKFQFPFQQNGYEYVSECSGRGLCNHDSGVCECFTGHTSDDCSVQNTLAK